MKKIESTFTAEALELFDNYCLSLEKEFENTGKNSHLNSHLSKYRSLLPSIALIFHVLEGKKFDNEIDLETLESAIKLLDFFKEHAEILYQRSDNRQIRYIKKFCDEIREMNVESNKTTFRELYRNGWCGLSKEEEVKDALNPLFKLGYIKVIRQFDLEKTRYKNVILIKEEFLEELNYRTL